MTTVFQERSADVVNNGGQSTNSKTIPSTAAANVQEDEPALKLHKRLQSLDCIGFDMVITQVFHLVLWRLR